MAGGWREVGSAPPLSQGVGYGICLGFGAAFSIVTTLLVWLNAKYGGAHITSEHFNTAGRSVRTGLIAAVVCSQWTWAATLLQSSNVAWQYGISGPFWYGAGACVQILLFGILSIEIKRKAPRAHTVCEIVGARWGPAAHKVFLGFCLLTNVLVTAMLLLGGAATISAMTGMSVHAAAFLIPLGIITYTFADGLAATFLSNYLHTIILHAVLLVFIVAVYLWPTPGGSSQLGSVRAVYDRLLALNARSPEECAALGLSACGPVQGNEGGSYLTMLSAGGIMFGVVNIVGNFGTVFVDQAYWQSAIAARPSAAVKGYLLGGLAWFAIPFALATSLGLACLALELSVSATQANAGLVPVASALELLGNGGGLLMLLMVFMAVTSCGSAELIAVSSLLTYDVYRTYINPHASGEQVLRVSRGCVVAFGLAMGGLAALLEAVGLQLGYLYLLMGCLVGSAVFPISAVLLWRKASATGAVAGAVIGQAVAVAAWLLSAYQLSEGQGLTLESTGKTLPMLIGNVTAIGVGAGITVAYGLWRPDNYDWGSTMAIRGVEEEAGLEMTEAEKAANEALKAEMEPGALRKAKAFVLKWGLAFTALMLFIWPGLSLPAGAPFSLPAYTAWVWVGIVWGFLSSIIITFLPLYESKDVIGRVVHGVLRSLSPAPSPDKHSGNGKADDVDASNATAAVLDGDSGEEEAKLAVVVTAEK